MPDHPYSEDYYLNGPASGLSNYENYHWLPDRTLPMALQLKWMLGIRSDDSVLDYGCARGYLVKALRMQGIQAHGYDLSEWAIANCDEGVKGFVSTTINTSPMAWDHIIAKDVFEHIPVDHLTDLVGQLLRACRKQLYIIVPLAVTRGGTYNCPVDEQDSTHVIRWTLPDWIEFLQRFDKNFVVSGGYEAPVVKPNCFKYPKSYGFLTVRRVHV